MVCQAVHASCLRMQRLIKTFFLSLSFFSSHRILLGQEEEMSICPGLLSSSLQRSSSIVCESTADDKLLQHCWASASRLGSLDCLAAALLEWAAHSLLVVQPNCPAGSPLWPFLTSASRWLGSESRPPTLIDPPNMVHMDSGVEQVVGGGWWLSHWGSKR